jgi:nicotinate-nucleotide adenylyltransferase
VGHLIAASDACRILRLDVLLLVPSAVHPFKHGRMRTPAPLRLEMVRAAVEGDPRLVPDALELERAGPSYTVDTLRAVRARDPGGALFFLTGADNLREFPSWREPDEILRLATLAVLSREGEGAAGVPGVPAVAVPVTRVDVSATEVRRRVAAGESIRYLVPEPVRAIIEREGLYRGPLT